MSFADYGFAWLLTNDAYLPGVLTSVHSLLDCESDSPANDFTTICLVTPESVSPQSISQLRGTFDLVIGVDALNSTSERELRLLGIFPF